MAPLVVPAVIRNGRREAFPSSWYREPRTQIVPLGGVVIMQATGYILEPVLQEQRGAARAVAPPGMGSRHNSLVRLKMAMYHHDSVRLDYPGEFARPCHSRVEFHVRENRRGVEEVDAGILELDGVRYLERADFATGMFLLQKSIKVGLISIPNS
jgi:hypothetical protein